LRLTTFDDIENAVSPKIAEGGCEAGSPVVAGSFSMDGVFVDTQDGRANAVRSFPGFELSVFVVDALDGGGAEFLVSGKNTACDSITVELVDVPTEGFGGVTVFFDTGQCRQKGFTALPALVAVSVNAETDFPSEGVEVADSSGIRPLAVDLQVPGLATLVTGTFRSTARAWRARACWLIPFQVNDRAPGLLLDSLHLVAVYSDLL